MPDAERWDCVRLAKEDLGRVSVYGNAAHGAAVAERLRSDLVDDLSAIPAVLDSLVAVEGLTDGLYDVMYCDVFYEDVLDVFEGEGAVGVVFRKLSELLPVTIDGLSLAAVGRLRDH